MDYEIEAIHTKKNTSVMYSYSFPLAHFEFLKMITRPELSPRARYSPEGSYFKTEIRSSSRALSTFS
jgi:hypothetical protein